MDVKVGETFLLFPSATTPTIGLIGNNGYKIEVYVPETDIGKIGLGNVADVTLDAYGPATIFPATVSLIDPAETVQDGISTYKVTLHFSQNDPRIKAGLTANVTIITATSSQVLAIPESAVIQKGNDSFVLVKEASGFTQKQIQTGIKSADGYVEAVSGLEDGDAVASFGNN